MGLTMAAFEAAGRRWTGKDALGGGDLKLMAAAAGFLGWPLAWFALLLGAVAGLPLMLLYQRLRGLHWREAAPFGPALALACAFCLWDARSGGLWVLKIFPLF
jgi:prepilin signal peptidase PulO-like enzyme (type II secretory pathway)